MDKLILICITFSILVVKVNSSPSGWSSWAECTESNICFRRRIFTCYAGEGIQCLNETNRGNFEQSAWNCTTSPKCLENVEEMFHASEVSALKKHQLSLAIELDLPTVFHTRVSKRDWL